MSYPYLSDLVNDLTGAEWILPIPMFGLFVGLAIMVSARVGRNEVIRYEQLGFLPAGGICRARDILPNLIVIVSLLGIMGARLFHILEYPHQFLHDPMGMILTRGGFSIYGGLLVGAVAGMVYVKKKRLPVLPMLDAMAPALALGYGIGRVGCQISGDGDWGIPADLSLKPEWLPQWFWSQTYDNNIAGIVIESPGVYPTPVYEVFAAFAIFGFLWLLRGSRHRAGHVFFMYLIFSGFARLLIEKIRINSQYELLGMQFTQAEFISTVLIIGGLYGVVVTSNSHRIWRLAFAVSVAGVLSACSVLV